MTTQRGSTSEPEGFLEEVITSKNKVKINENKTHTKKQSQETEKEGGSTGKKRGIQWNERQMMRMKKTFKE